jgi:hypothetical protein
MPGRTIFALGDQFDDSVRPDGRSRPLRRGRRRAHARIGHELPGVEMGGEERFDFGPQS